MQRAVLVLEAINAVVGIGANLVALQSNQAFGIPVGYLNSVFFGLFFLGFLLLYLNNERVKREITADVVAQLQGVTMLPTPPIGSLDAVSSQDKRLITAMAIDMAISHGHLDLEGLLADRASSIPLNELKQRPCSVCGVARDTKSDKWGKGV